MCKIMGIIGIPERQAKRAWQLTKAAQPFLTKSDSDGYGYVAVNKDGTQVIERWLNVDDAFKSRERISQDGQGLLAEFESLIELDEVYNSEGDITRVRDTVSILSHARMATCDLTLTNVHPFVKDGTALIHNGVVSSPTVKNETSTCDSELILNSYVQNGVSTDIDAFQGVTDSLTGYYAALVAGEVNGTPYIDVIKDDTAQLWMIKVSRLDAIVICTDPAIIRKACAKLGWTVTAEANITESTVLRLDAKTGKMLTFTHFLKAKAKAVEVSKLDAMEMTSDWASYEAKWGDMKYGR